MRTGLSGSGGGACARGGRVRPRFRVAQASAEGFAARNASAAGGTAGNRGWHGQCTGAAGIGAVAAVQGRTRASELLPTDCNCHQNQPPIPAAARLAAASPIQSRLRLGFGVLLAAKTLRAASRSAVSVAGALGLAFLVRQVVRLVAAGAGSIQLPDRRRESPDGSTGREVATMRRGSRRAQGWSTPPLR